MSSSLFRVKMFLHDTVGKSLIQLFGSHDNRALKYRVSLCLIFKNEARFLSEWIDFHHLIGVDHFYLYNNNSSDNYAEVLKPYIDSGLVTFHDWPQAQGQISAYKHCFENYGKETNWIGYFDTDEFICMRKDTQIADFLNKFDKYPLVCLYWHMFGSGGILEHDDSQLVIEQYTSCQDHLASIGKNFFNTRFSVSNWWLDCMHHWPMASFPVLGLNLNVHAVNIFGAFAAQGLEVNAKKHPLDSCEVKLNHYFSKSWDIYAAKAQMSDVTYKENPKKKMSYYYQFEEACTTKDFVIQRFLMKLKLFRKGISL